MVVGMATGSAKLCLPNGHTSGGTSLVLSDRCRSQWPAALVAPPYFTMEQVLAHAAKACPFLHHASVATLRQLSASKSYAAGSTNALLAAAQRCPVMSNAIAVQASHFSTTAMALQPPPAQTSPRNAAIMTEKQDIEQASVPARHAGMLLLIPWPMDDNELFR